MRRFFGGRPTRFGRGDAVRLKTGLPDDGLESGRVGTIVEVRRGRLTSYAAPAYGVQFIDAEGVVGRFEVDEADLMPADGRRFDDNDAVRLRRDVPTQGLTSGTVGTVSEVSPGPPVRYVVDFADANGTITAQTALFDEDLSSPDAPVEHDAESQPAGAEPEETGLADDQLDQLIAELRTQGQAMQQQTARERAEGVQEGPQAQEEAQAQESQAPVEQAQEEPQEPQAEEPQVPAAQAPQEPDEPPAVKKEPPADGRRTRYVRGETVRLEAELTSAGFEAGAEGTVVWAILGPPVSYLVEFRNPDGGTSSPTKVQESDLSYVG